MKILVINAGSSSLKFQLIDMDDESVKAKGLVERIGIEGTHFKQTVLGTDKVIEFTRNMKDHTEAISAVLSALTDKDNGAITSLDEIGACGHRVLHGGETFKNSVLVTEETMKGIEELVPLGPLHQPANIAGIKDSSGNWDNLKGYIEATKGMDFSVLSGNDSLILPALKACLKEGGQVAALIKPQFEAGKGEVGKNGVVREAALHTQICAMIMQFAQDIGFWVRDLSFSPITGPKGNIEFLLYLENSGNESLATLESFSLLAAQIVAQAHESCIKS